MSLETKTHLDQETINQLQDLIQANIDSRDEFRHASNEIQDLTLSTLFQSLSVQREEQANELSHFVQINEQSPCCEGSLTASLSRMWMSIREQFSSNNLYAVLAEVERGEDQIKHAYEQALRSTAGSAMNDVLTRHYTQVKAAHDRIRDLRDEHKSDH